MSKYPYAHDSRRSWDAFNDYIDELFEPVKIWGCELNASWVFAKVDPIATQVAYNDWWGEAEEERLSELEEREEQRANNYPYLYDSHDSWDAFYDKLDDCNPTIEVRGETIDPSEYMETLRPKATQNAYDEWWANAKEEAIESGDWPEDEEDDDE